MVALSQTISWECKHCHHPVSDDDSVAFHLIDGFLYGWCRECFNAAAIKRAQQQLQATQPPAK